MIALDKQAHFLGGIALAGLAAPFGLPAVVAGVIAAAVGKEIYDSYRRDVHTPEVADAVATLLGGAAYLGWLELLGALR